MGLTVIALAAGVVAGLAAGGRPADAGRRPIRAAAVLVVALGAGTTPRLFDVPGSTGLAFVLASYALLAVFTLANLRLVGMPVVLLGLALNTAVIAVNAGMPVRADAVLAADPGRSASDLAELRFDAKRHLEGDGDRLTFLGDVVPVAPLGQVVSFGDLILAAGIFDVAFRLLKPAGAGRGEARAADGAVASGASAVGELAGPA